MNAPAAKSRNDALDQFRFLAFVGVLFIHMASVRGGQDAVQTAFDVLSFVGRFAVPFFFIAAGFFLKSERGREAATIAGAAKRLLVPFLVWEAFYAVISYRANPAYFAEQIARPDYWWNFFVNGGAGYHLWFMTSLFLCMAMVVLLRRVLPDRGVLAVSAAFFLIGLACGPYAALLFGADNTIHFMTRNGPFFGLLFVAIGACGKDMLHGLGLRAGGWLALAGFALLTGECWAIERATGYPMIEQDFVVGTLPFAVGFFAFALKFPWVSLIAARGGRISLGCYAVHLYFVEKSLALCPKTGVGGVLAALLAVALSVLVAYGLSRIKLTKPLVA